MATAPQDVDLEDHLAFGLSPMRFGYLVLVGLSAFVTWNVQTAPILLRVFGLGLLILAGSVLVWGRWRGRRLDGLLGDLSIYLFRWVLACLSQRRGFN